MAKLKATPKNFADALNLFNTTRTTGKCSIRLGNNTYLESYTDGTKIDRFCVRLHNTNIVEFLHDGRIRLYSGGWHSVTTKERINQFVNGTLYQQKGTWYYQFTNEPNQPTVIFSEGLDISCQPQ
jgi:hypothetical protein